MTEASPRLYLNLREKRSASFMTNFSLTGFPAILARGLSEVALA